MNEAPSKPLTVAQQIKAAQQRERLAVAEIRAGRAERLSVLAAKNKYDVLSSQAQRKRRQPAIERQVEEKLLRLYDRLRAINLCRDLERNFTAAKSALNQFRINVVGIGPKLRVHTPTDEDAARQWRDTAADWFNHVWAKQCSFRNDDHLAEQLGNAITAIKREGDILVVFDDGIVENSGKLIWFEADQLVEISDFDSVGELKGMRQESGIIYDKYGRVYAYAVCAENGKHSAKASECTIIKRDIARLLKNTWRANQLRGTSAMLTAAADLQDLYEMRSKELQSAKVASSFAGTVTKQDAVTEMDMHRQGNEQESDSVRPSYDRLESLTGGYLEYLDQGDDFKILDFNRPSVNFTAANDWILRTAATALGLSKTYSTLNTEASYTAFRGDLLLSWNQFSADQKNLERHCVDWIAAKAIAWAVSNKKIPAAPEAAYSFSWTWPTMPAVDPLKEATATVMNLSNLLTDYSDVHGPDWPKKFAALAEQAEKAKQLLLPLMIWENPKDGLNFTKSATMDTANGGDLEAGKAKP